MPIISSFTGAAARGFGFTNGLPPLPPASISFTPSALNAVVTFTTSATSYPVDYVQAKIMQDAILVSDWATVTSSSNISAANLTPAVLYTVYFRTRDTGGQVSEETSATFTTNAETAPGAPTFTLAVASGNPGTFKFNITSTGGTVGTYSRTTEYRVENSAGTVVLTDWTTISSNTNTITAYGADTYNGSGALSPATTYRVRLRSVAATSGTITYAAYQTVTTNAIVAPGAPSFSSAPAPIAGTAGEFSFKFTPSAGSANSYPVASTRYRIRTNNTVPYTYLSGYSTFAVVSGETTIGTSTYSGAILYPGTTYYVDLITYDTQGTASSITSASVTTSAKRNPTAGSVTVAAPTYDGTNTSSLNVTPSGFTAGSWPISYYIYTTDLVNSYTLSGNSVGGLSPDTAYTVTIAAVDTQGNTSSGVSGSATTNSPVPSAPSLYWDGGMGSTSAGTASLFMTIPSYAVDFFVQYTSDGFASYGTAQFTGTSGGYKTGSIGSQPYNSTMQYRAYVRNKHGYWSSYSNTRVWITPKKNQTYVNTYLSGEFVLAATNSALSGCSPPPTSLTFGSIPATDDSVGYVRIDYVGVQLKTGGFSNTVTSYLYFSYPGGTASTSLSPNTDATYSLRVETISVGGSTLSNGTITLNFLWDAGGAAGSAARLASSIYGCVPNGNNWFYAKDLYVQGVQTTGGLPY